MLWLKEEDKLTLNHLSIKKARLACLNSTLEKSKVPIITGSEIKVCSEYSQNTIKGLYLYIEGGYPKSLLYTPYPTSSEIIESITNKFQEKNNIELESLKGNTIMTFSNISELVDAYNITPELMHTISPDLFFFATEILDDLTFDVKREVSIKKLKELKEQATAIGIKNLGFEYDDLTENLEIGEKNEEVLTLAKKINKKLK